MKVRGTRVLITGAGSGIGRSTALRFADQAAEVIVVDIDAETASKTAERCRPKTEAHAYTCDVSDGAAMQALAAQIESERGPVDVLVNNAGVGVAGPFLDNSLEDWEWLRGVNLDGVVHGCHAFGAGMVKRRRGHVVNIASGAGYTPQAYLATYCATKAGVISLSQCLRADWARQGVGVSVICPGVINTPIPSRTRMVGPMAGKQEKAQRAMRLGHSPDLVAKAIVGAVEHNRGIVPVGFESTFAFRVHALRPRSPAGSVREIAAAAVSRHRIVIVGAGLAGVGMGVRLRQAGVEDFVICERNPSVGGTWFEHTYPGCACDIPTHLYSYSFARNPNWSRLFPRQREILEYVRRTAERYGVSEHIRLGCEMLRSRWDEGARVWRLETSEGELEAEVLISAIGATAEPDDPDIPGWRTFKGTRFHSARWNHDHDLTGERVGVIGTGPAAAQFVPLIQRKVSKLVVFQRTPPWVVPHPDRPAPAPERLLYKLAPGLQDLQRNLFFGVYEACGVGFRGRKELIAPLEALGRAHLRRQVKDPDLREKLTPHYRFGCKRPVLSNTFYPALTQPNVELVTSGIRRVNPRSISTRDGVRHELDTIITATGYRYNRSLLVERVIGKGGRTLGEVWDRSPRAYLGSAVPGFPNMFILLGPNAIGINSVIYTLESQIAYVLSALQTMERRGARRIEVRHEALESYVHEVDRRSVGSVWTHGGCTPYYVDDNGRNFAIYPGFAAGFRRRTRRFDSRPYELEAA